MQEQPVYSDVVGEVLDYLRRRCDALLAAGVEQTRIALDPGIGFGKTTVHNLLLLSEDRAVPCLGLSAAGRAVAEAIHRRSARRFRCGPHGRHHRRGSWPWPVATCRSSASTTWPQCGRRCRCSRQPDSYDPRRHRQMKFTSVFPVRGCDQRVHRRTLRMPAKIGIRPLTPLLSST